MLQQSLFAPALEPSRVPTKTVVRFLDRSQILTKPTGAAAVFDYTLNPYVGCAFGCSYCFASFFQADEQRFQTWGTWVDVKRRAVEDIARKRNLKGKSIFMSSATDPYQPIEAKLELTRCILEVLLEPWRQPRLVVQTRGPLVSRDFDLLSRFDKVRLNMSITSDSDAVRKRFEPNCASIERRLATIAEARKAGIPTTVCIAPMLPIENPRLFAEMIRATNTTYVVASKFRKSDRPFAASTRQQALDLSSEYGWDNSAVERTIAELTRYMPELNDRTRGWLPS
jgi:DNA repair photolyase